MSIAPQDAPQVQQVAPLPNKKLLVIHRVESLFPKGRAAGSPTVMSETNGLRRALGATAGIDIGNPLIQDERVSIKYP